MKLAVFDTKTQKKAYVELLESYQKAKSNTTWLLDNPDGLADMHGLVYWAGEVERLRKEIKELL